MKIEAEAKKESEIYEDVWIPTQCRRCHGMCSLLAHRVNGVVVRLEGNPDSCVGSKGGVCAKGLSAIQILYDPNRLKVPLRRTNPEKGIGVDPKWKEISWDEALDEIAMRLKKVVSDDPNKILIQSGLSVLPTSMSVWKMMLISMLSSPKGAPGVSAGGTGTHCGNSGHVNGTLNGGAWGGEGTTHGCKYYLVFGSSGGFGNWSQAMNKENMDLLANGMKVAVFDPVCSHAGAKATDWIPIIPGTDGAVILAMLNVIVNELGIYDAPFLKTRTNAPYLIGPDGHYIRDKETNKPMIWDTTESKAKIFEDPTVGDFDLDGSYEVNGIKCRPAWQALKEQFKKYPPEKASKISGVPAETIRRIAKEFAEAAMVGATVEVEGGIRIRHRPVKTMSIRGIGGHKNGYHTVYLVGLLTQVLGAADAYGGSHIGLGVDLRYREDLPTIATSPVKDFNGFPTNKGKWVVPFGRFPLPEVKSPHQRDLHDLFLMQFDTPMYGISNREEILQKAKLDPKIEVVINYGCDSLISIANPRDSAKFFKTVPFMVDFELWGTELNEGFADIVLPDTCSLEYSDWGPLVGGFFGQTTQLAEPWTFQTTNRVVEPQYSRRYVMDVTLDILDRMGLRAKTNEYLNAFIGFGDTLKLKPTDKLNWEELGDRVVRHYFGDEHNWEWFKKHGFISWPKKPEDFYSGCFSNIRIQVYREFMIDLGKNIKKVASELGIEMDWKQYIPGPDWFPCPPHEVKDPRYDLYCFAYRDPLHMDACTMEQPWLDECSKINPYTYNITMSAEMCQEKGLKEGDTIELESDKGNKVQGVLHLRKGQHPQAVAIMGTAGHFAFGQPIARGKGVSFVSLMENRWEDCDPIVFNLELCVKVKVTKIK